MNSLPLYNFGIIGFRIFLKGKLFKKTRKKKFLIKQGKLPLVNPLFCIKYIRYFIFTRAGSYSFHF